MLGFIKKYVASNQRVVKACLLFLLVNFFWGASFPFTKIALESVPYFYLIGFRFLIASIFFVTLFRKKLKLIDKKIIKQGAVLAVMMTLSILLQTIGVDKTTSTNASFYTGFAVLWTPIFIMIGSFNLPKGKTMLSMAIAMVGLYLFSYTGEKSSFNPGDFICLAGSMFFALQLIFTGKFVGKSDVILLTIVQALFCTIFSFTIAGFAETAPTAITMEGFGSLVILGFFCTALAYWIQNRVQKDLTPTTVATISVMEPVFGAILSGIILGESLSFIAKIGAVFIAGAMLLSQDSTEEEEAKEEGAPTYSDTYA